MSFEHDQTMEIQSFKCDACGGDITGLVILAHFHIKTLDIETDKRYKDT